MSSIACACVRIRRSLLPRRSRWWSLNRSPRNAASSSCRSWIIVPIAPSSTRMRSRASARRVASVGDIFAVTGSSSYSSSFSRCLLRAGGAEAEQMRDGEDEVGTVHGVEVKVVDAVLVQLLHLTGRDGRRDQLARLGIVVEALELFRKP